jgi:hypothetical protein
MLRTVEALFMVVITFGAMLVVTNYVYIPPPRITSSIGQQEYAQDLLQRIDENKALTNAVFSESNEGWSSITKTLVDILPPNVVFNITAYKISEDVLGTLRYVPVKTRSNFEGVFPSGSVSVSYVMTSPEVTVTQTPEKIGYKTAGGQQMFITLYILKCTDANGWWITGFTGESLAWDAYKQMSPYFDTTVMVNSTADFERLLNGNKPKRERGARNHHQHLRRVCSHTRQQSSLLAVLPPLRWAESGALQLDLGINSRLPLLLRLKY